MSADCCCHFTWLPLMLLLDVLVAFLPAAKVEEVLSAVFEQLLSF